MLNGDNVFPPVKTNATGKAELTLLGDRNTMSYKVTGGPVDEVKDVTISHTTGGEAHDIVVLRSATQTGLSGQMKSATLAGNFTSSDFIRGPKDMAALVNDILSGNVILRVDTLKFPLGIVAGKLNRICSPEASNASGSSFIFRRQDNGNGLLVLIRFSHWVVLRGSATKIRLE